MMTGLEIRMRVIERCVVGVALTLVCVGGCRRGTESAHEAAPPVVIVATPGVRSVTDYYHYTGTTAPVEDVEVRARVAGELKEIRYTPSTRVEAGDELFLIEPDAYLIARDAAQAERDRAAAALEIAELTRQRTATASEQGAANQQELDNAVAIVKQRRAELNQAQSRLDDAELQLSYTVVRAPISGFASRGLVDVGNLVGLGEATHLTNITQMNPIWVYFDVSERIVLEYLAEGRNGKRGDGQDEFPIVEVALASSPEGEYPFSGRINWVANIVDQTTGTIRVRGELSNTDDRLFPGLFVRARVAREILDYALVVPENAIATGLDGPYLLVVGSDNTVGRRPVELGPADGSMRVIKRGITAEDRVVVSGLQKAMPGSVVTPTEASAPSGSSDETPERAAP